MSGTPTQPGTYSFVITARDKSSRNTRQFTLVVGPSNPNVSITVSPASAAVTAGLTQQFTAAVRNTSNTAVTWTTTAGTVSSSGLFTAPAVTSSTTVTVTATSAADGKASASAQVAVSPAVIAAPAALAITTRVVPEALAGQPYAGGFAAQGGTPPYQWSLTSGKLPSGFSLSSSNGQISGATQETGDFALGVGVTDAASKTATANFSLTVSAQAAGMDGPAELPRVYVSSAMSDTPAPGKTIPVSAGADLQAAINSAACGDTLELQAGTTFSGIYNFPAKNCDNQHWIIVRTSAADSALPPEGTRLTPCYAGVSSLAGRPALSCAATQNVLAKIVIPGAGVGPVVLGQQASQYRFIGLEITRTANGDSVSNLISGSGQASNIVFDRVWIHGTAQDETRRGLEISGISNFALVDSYVNDFHCNSQGGTCGDSQGLLGGLGDVASSGIKIVNNFLEGGAENIMLGGDEATTTPTDVEVRHNHLFKPRIWQSGQTGFVGGANGSPFIVKNLFELKNAQRVLLEGNVLENSWGGFSQNGYAVMVTPRNQVIGSQNVCPACQVTDVVIRKNIITHAGGGIVIAAALTGGLPAKAAARFSIHDVTIDDISASTYSGAGTLFMIMNEYTSNVLNGISVRHVTGFPDLAKDTMVIGSPGAAPKMSNFTFSDNLIALSIYPLWSVGEPSDCADTDIPVTTLNTCFSSFTFDHNALIAPPPAFPSSKWPAGNLFPASSSVVGFVNFNGGNGGDYHLSPSSSLKGAASDGTDIGADIDAILAATAGVR